MNQREQYNALVEGPLTRLEERLAEIGPNAPRLAVSPADLDERELYRRIFGCEPTPAAPGGREVR